MQLKIRFTLKRGSLTIRKNPRSKSPINLIYLSYTGFAADVIQYPFGSYKADVSLKGMLCTDGSTPGTLYPNLIKAKEKKEGMEDRTSQSGIISTAKPSFSDHNINFFNMRVEIKPLDDRADSAVEVKMLPLEVVYNPDAIKALISFFNNPYSNYDSVTFGGGELSAIKAAKDTIQDITSQTRLSLEHAIQEHSTLALKIDVDAPIFIFPEK